MMYSSSANTIYKKLRRCGLVTRVFIAWVMVFGQTLPLYANPIDGVVSAGSANIDSAGNTLTVTQQTDKAVIDWRGFDIAHGETTEFKQPNASSMTLNRVNGNAPSFIDGNLTANGNLIVVNPNGVWFGGGARVDVNGLIASTAGISNDAFMNASGTLNFDIAGNPDAGIVNDGLITAKEAGLVGLVAPNVVNRGIILARLGRVALASGDTATVDMYGDGLVNVAVSDAVKSQLVSNSGLIVAEGGTIALTAAAGKNIVNSLISVSGELAAPSVSTQNGKIIIAAAGSNKTAKQGYSTVLVSGILDASGRNAGERGGSIVVTGDNVGLLSGTRIDASGSDGLAGTTLGKLASAIRTGSAGGDIRIGGDYLGQGDTPTALNLYVDSDTLILNDAINSGDAGRTIFWSDNNTQFYGNVYARALSGNGIDQTTWHAMDTKITSNTGDGGFVETSGHHQLDAGGYVDLTASNGARGTYFLDPTNITIYGNFAPNYATVIQGDSTALSANLKLWLDAADTTKVNLTYSALTTAGANACASSCLTASGTSGATTITTSANVAAALKVGQRIRLGAAGSVTAASTLGADTYTISAISGTTITFSSALTTTYTNSTVYGGYVSQLTDKSGVGNNATQATASKMPLWISNGQNNLGVASFNGTSTYLGVPTTLFTGASNAPFTVFGGYNQNNLSGNQNIFSIVASQSYQVGTRSATFGPWKSGGAFWASTTAPSALSWHQFATVYNGTNDLVYSDSTLANTTAAAINTSSITAINIGSFSNGSSEVYSGLMNELYFYNSALSTNAVVLLSQYQSAKWAVALTPPGSGATEAAKATASIQKGDAVDGYSVFTTRYLERLSQSANISLRSSNNITLDLQGDTMNFTTAGRTLTLTAGNIISTASTGGITTNGGAINLTATNGININHAFTFNPGAATTTLTTTNAPISFTGSVTIGGDLVLNAGNANISVAAINGVAVGTSNVTVSAGSGTFTTTGVIGGTNRLNNLNVTADDVALGANINGSGTLTLQTNSNARAIKVNYGAADGTHLNLSTTEIGYFVDGWSQINIGKVADIEAVWIGSSTFVDPITFRSGWYGFLDGTLTSSGNAAVTFNIPTMYMGGGATTITSAGNSVSFSNTLALYQGTYAINTSGGNVTITGNTAQTFAIATSLSINAGAGALSFGGTVNANTSNPLSVTASAASITMAGAWGGTGALGAVSLTSTNSIILPAISASSINVQTSAVSGKISLGGALTASVTTGNGIVLNAGNEIATTLASTLTTSGSNISLTGVNGIGLYHATTLSSSNGDITFNSPLYLGAAQTISAGAGVVTFASTIDSLTAVTNANVLVVAGGGGGGGGTAGGGGAGGLLSNTAYTLVTNGSVTVTIGNGGIAGSATNVAGASGTNSVFGTLTAIGGGGGGANSINGLSGGSGGGSGHNNTSGGSGTAGQGFGSVATNNTTAANYGASGGGGAGGMGQAGTNTTGGNGGAGVSSSITGSAVTYAGGGGGGTYLGGTVGLGGAGGGGAATVAGTANTGGGGGGATNNTGNGGVGGSGVVIVRYTGRSGQATVTGNATSTTVGGDTVWTYTSGSGTFVANSVGCAGGCGLNVTAGTINMNGNVGSTNALGAVSLTAINSMTLPSITAASVNVQTTAAAADITIGAAKVITATGAGTPLTFVAGRNFINNSGAGALATPSGRSLVYSTNPAADTVGGLSNSFRRFSCTYGGSCPSMPSTGNGLLYRTTPTITATANAIPNIVYGATVPTLSNYTYSLTGYLGSDAASDGITGTLNGITNYIQGASIGTYAINYLNGTLASSMGYAVSYANNASAFTVTPRAITVAADAKNKVYGSVDPSLTYQITSGSLYGSDIFTGALSRSVGENVLTGPYAINRNTLTAGGNYNLTYVSNNLTITPAALTVTANNIIKLYGTQDTALTYTITGLVNGDKATAVTGNLSRIQGSVTGQYSILRNTVSASSNYTLKYVSGQYIITENDIPVTVTRVSQDPTLNMSGSSGGAVTTTQTSSDQPSSPTTLTSNDVVVPGQYGQGGWLTISPALIAMLGGLPSHIKY